MKTENATLSSLGFAKKLIGKEKTAYFVGGRGTESIIMVPDVGPMKLVEERIKSLRDLLETKKDKFDKVLNSRISQLAGGIAVIRVGAKSQAEKFYLKLKIEDARNSCLSALKYGVVPGGGLAYQKVAEELGPDALIYEALMEPAKRIQKNFGRKFDVAKNIVDSFGVSKSSLVSAISVVKTLITMEGIIAEEDVTLVDQLNKKLIGE
jgi:chaperonin GroEL